MPSAKKLARQRHARERQQEQMRNLAQGAAEAQQQQQQQFQQQPQNSRATADDPKGQVLSTGGDQFQVRVVSAGAKPFQQSGPGGGNIQKMPAGHNSRNSAMNVQVMSGRGGGQRGASVTVNKKADPAVTTRAYGAGQVMQQPVPPQPVQAQIPIQKHPVQAFELPPPVPQAQIARADVTIYLTCYERPAYFRRQLQALRAQTVQPAHMVVIVNRGDVNQDEQALSAAQTTTIRANANLGPWFRFTAALEAPTKYVCILDDDTLPGPQWLQAAIERLEAAEQDPDIGDLCIAAAGEVFRTDDPASRYDVGPQSPRDEELEVDVGRQGWVFRRDLLLAFMSTPRQGTGQIGWAHHLAASLQLQDVLTVVLPYPPNNKEAWGMLEMPSQERKLSQTIEALAARGGPNMMFLRQQLYAAYRSLGWSPLVVLDAEASTPEEAAAD